MLTQLLRPQLEKARNARVVNVASGAHNGARKGLDFDDLEWEQRRYRGFTVYSCTKLMNIYFTRELSKRWETTGITSNALHPGFVASNFAKERDYGVLGNIVMPLSRPFSISVAKGAQTSIYLCSSPDVEGICGQYCYKNRVGGPRAAALDDNAAARLWEISEKLTASA
jgi:NAD(P)-dependent dehydrogenase (short-subunit alcohol dehydrogenase family)